MQTGASAGRRLALIAGAGELPLIAAGKAREKGFSVVACALPGVRGLGRIRQRVEALRILHPARWGELLRQLEHWGVTDILPVGKFPRALLCRRLPADPQACALLGAGNGRVSLQGDDPVVAAFVGDLEARGFRLQDQVELLDLPAAGKGLLGGAPPAGREGEILYGSRLARAVAALGIGQTVVVKGGACVAVEAACGTDATIRRAGRLAGPGACVVKVAGPGRDFRFDLPTVGRETLRAMAAAGADLLVLEAGRVFLVPGHELYAEAAAMGISVVGVDLEAPGLEAGAGAG